MQPNLVRVQASWLSFLPDRLRRFAQSQHVIVAAKRGRDGLRADRPIQYQQDKSEMSGMIQATLATDTSTHRYDAIEQDTVCSELVTACWNGSPKSRTERMVASSLVLPEHDFTIRRHCKAGPFQHFKLRTARSCILYKTRLESEKRAVCEGVSKVFLRHTRQIAGAEFSTVWIGGSVRMRLR